MPRRAPSGTCTRIVQGLYDALLEAERARLERTPMDPRWAYTERGRAREPPPERQTSSRRLEASQAGEPMRLQGRNLRSRSLPVVKLRRDQAFDWFEIRPDDTVRQCDTGNNWLGLMGQPAADALALSHGWHDGDTSKSR